MIVLVLINVFIIFYLYFKFFRLPNYIKESEINIKDMDTLMIRIYK